MAKVSSSKDLKAINGVKRQEPEQVESERPTKRSKGLLEQDDTSDEEHGFSSDNRELPVRNDRSEPDVHGFKVNLEFARRFEYNKKREELQKRE